MTRKLIAVLFFCFTFFTVIADPIEDMTMEEAKNLVKYLKDNPYLVDYCDCCDRNPGGERIFASLIRVSNTEIVPCTYDESRYSVKLTATVIAGGYIDKKGEMENIEFQGHVYENEYDYPTLATLNYHFTYQKGKVIRLGDAIKYEIDRAYNCNPLTAFPPAKNMGEFQKPYQKFLKKNGK